MSRRLIALSCLICLMTSLELVAAQTPAQTPRVVAPAATTRPARPTPPTRDPNTPGYVAAKDLTDGANAPINGDGNFILGPTHTPAPETIRQEGVPQGTIFNFTMSSTDSKIYPGIARDPGTFRTPNPDDPAKMLVTTSHPGTNTLHVAVYAPQQHVALTLTQFFVGA